MKRTVFSVLLLLCLTACSVQENMSPELFFDRLQKFDSNISINNSFYDNENFICYMLYHNADIIFEIQTDNEKNSIKINLACTDTDKINEFTDCAESVIKIYAPDDDINTVSKNLFDNKNINNNFTYYDTQWHSYSASLSDNGLYFSVSSKKLMPESEVGLTLKQNDIVEY